ncbi:hypothetical protein [Priestia megaterium]|uniref:hypothetical protein n=1 Tax=Priestia megaterium TaxID=1404 RepID=UPI0031017614
MNNSDYSMLGSAFYNPKDLVLKMIKKTQLNSLNMRKYFKMENFEGIKERLINSIHLLEELDMSLNRDTINPTVERVSIHYQWLMQGYEEILLTIEEDTFNEDRFNQILEESDTVIDNLYEGFAGMRDDNEDEYTVKNEEKNENEYIVRNEQDESNR